MSEEWHVDRRMQWPDAEYSAESYGASAASIRAFNSCGTHFSVHRHTHHQMVAHLSDSFHEAENRASGDAWQLEMVERVRGRRRPYGR